MGGFCFFSIIFESRRCKTILALYNEHDDTLQRWVTSIIMKPPPDAIIGVIILKNFRSGIEQSGSSFGS